MADRPTKIADYATRCEVCDEAIHEGDPIALHDDGAWVHEGCAEG
jgi:hypothetical protein